jgi:glycosyltransferase involved in cell wall biosynthesis
MITTLSIAISTVSHNFDKFINQFKFENLNQADEVLVIIQGSSSIDIPKGFNDKYKIIKEPGYGLSRSRNKAIMSSTCDYIWFLDDDISIDENSIPMIKAAMEGKSHEVFSTRMFIDANLTLYKNYPKEGLLSKKDIISISSVEIIVFRQFLLKHNLYFNINFGLGTQYPSCEENIFLLDLYKNGASIYHLPISPHRHPYVDRTKDFTRPGVLFAKGVFCNRFGGALGLILVFWWIIRSFYYSKSIRLSKYLLKGYNESRYKLN